MRIGIILGSTREGRIGDKIAGWLDQVAQKREGEATYEPSTCSTTTSPFSPFRCRRWL